MERYGLLPDEIIVEQTGTERKGPRKVKVSKYTAYNKKSGKVLGSIEFEKGPIPTMKLINVGVCLKRDVLLLGHSSKREAGMKLIGKHGINLTGFGCVLIKSRGRNEGRNSLAASRRQESRTRNKPGTLALDAMVV